MSTATPGSILEADIVTTSKSDTKPLWWGRSNFDAEQESDDQHRVW